MADFHGNNPYLRLNSVDIEAKFIDVNGDLDRGEEDLSRGAGSTWEKAGGKLLRASGTISIAYDDVDMATDLSNLWDADGVVPMVWGPEDNTAGKPQFAGDVLLTKIGGLKQTHDKSRVMLQYAWRTAAAPTKNLWAGDTF